jgi:hypothetical protein
VAAKEDGAIDYEWVFDSILDTMSFHAFERHEALVRNYY